MGALQASEMAAMADLRTALHWHLRSNHFPPVPAEMIDPAIAAIDACVAGDWDTEIDLPEGFTWKDREWVPAYILVNSLHLHAWLGDPDDWH